MPRAMSRLDLEVERDIVADPDRVLDVLDDPWGYPSWVATLRSLDEGPRGTWTARAGYLGYERVLTFRRLPAPEGAVAWRGRDSGFVVALELTVTPKGTRRATLAFAGSIEGTDRILGLRVEHQLIAVSLRLAAEHTLTQLERVAAAQAAGLTPEPI